MAVPPMSTVVFAGMMLAAFTVYVAVKVTAWFGISNLVSGIFAFRRFTSLLLVSHPANSRPAGASAALMATVCLPAKALLDVSVLTSLLRTSPLLTVTAFVFAISSYIASIVTSVPGIVKETF